MNRNGLPVVLGCVWAVFAIAIGACAAGVDAVDRKAEPITASPHAREVGIDGYVVDLLGGVDGFEVELLGRAPLVLIVERDGAAVHARTTAVEASYDLVVRDDMLLAVRDDEVVADVRMEAGDVVSSTGRDVLVEDPTWVAMTAALADDALWGALQEPTSTCGGAQVGCHELGVLWGGLARAIRIAVWGAVCLDACSACAADPMNGTACSVCNSTDCRGVPGGIF